MTLGIFRGFGYMLFIQLQYQWYSMRKWQEDKNEVVLYDSIYEMPIGRFNEFNKRLVMDLGMGHDSHSFRARLKSLEEYLSLQEADYKKNIEGAFRELHNLYQNFHAAVYKINYKALCFATLVKSIGGEECGYRTDEALNITVSRLDEIGYSWGELIKFIDEVKKNLTRNFDLSSQS